MHWLIARWRDTPLYLRIVIALGLGAALGLVIGPVAAGLAYPGQLVLRLLGALAPPLILFAILHALMSTELGGGLSLRLAGLLLLNTSVAIGIGLLVANLLQPGAGATLSIPSAAGGTGPGANPWIALLDNIPKSVLGPLGDDGRVLGVILLAVAFGIALRGERERRLGSVQDLVELGFICLRRVLLWVIALVPLAVFGIVASIVGTRGFQDFAALGWFVLSVLAALVLQAVYYLARIRYGSWARPWAVLQGVRDALTMAFSTASSTATMPVTYACLREKVGLRERSATLGAFVGANFNNDGTALYEAMAALFIAQVTGLQLPFETQLILVVTSVVASVGAAGIPEAGLVTMTLVFTAVGLPVEYIGVLLTVDWFLDRCRTAINVMGDVNVSCLLDGRQPQAAPCASEPV